MKLLILDEEGGMGLALAMRARDNNHDVQLWIPPLRSGESSPIGKGIVARPAKWEPHVKEADLIVMTGNSQYRTEFNELIERDYPVLGACNCAAEWETDRHIGQEVFKKADIETSAYQVFDNLDDGIKYVEKEQRGFAIKPWGGAADKALSFTAKRPDDIILKLQRIKEAGKFKGEFMLQELVDGIEMGVSGWFGPGGWSRWIEEDWEEKRLMNDRLGPNTGEQGTIVRFIKNSKLFDEVLDPVTEQLEEANYVGNVNVNCIIDSKGKPWPLEFTMRLGWPAFNIQLALTKDDPIEWMLTLLEGRDTLSLSEDIAVGVVLTHGDYPHGKKTLEEVSGYPLRGVTARNIDDLYFQHVKLGKAPTKVGQRIESVQDYVTAGDYVLVATGTGETVQAASKRAYKTIKQVEIGGCDRMYRTDIGKRLKKELPILQSQGYALGMNYS